MRRAITAALLAAALVLASSCASVRSIGSVACSREDLDLSLAQYLQGSGEVALALGPIRDVRPLGEQPTPVAGRPAVRRYVVDGANADGVVTLELVRKDETLWTIRSLAIDYVSIDLKLLSLR